MHNIFTSNCSIFLNIAITQKSSQVDFEVQFKVGRKI